MRRWLMALSLVVASRAAVAHEMVALTFDDLPALTLLKSQSYVTYTNEKLLRGLKHHHLSATGFVNEGKFDELDRPKQIMILRKWLEAGMDLGNHSFSHESPNKLSADGYILDIAKGEQVTRPLAAEYGRTLQWFRHPYLETGTPLEVKQKIDAWLGSHGYRIAPVTMENSDWLFAEPYDDAIARHDDARANRIKAAYLAYTAKVIPWYQNAAHLLLGRDISYVMLLHVARLNADCIDQLNLILSHDKLHVVTLGKAMQDPAYQRVDDYAGPDGIEWLERWSLSLHKDLPWSSFPEPPPEIESDYRRVDNDL